MVSFIGAGSILNVRGPGVCTVRAQIFKPHNGNAFVTLMAKMKKQRWITGKNSRFQGEQQRN